MFHRSLIIFLLLFAVFFSGCEKDKPEPPSTNSKINISAETPVDISYRRASISGIIGETYGRTINKYGHCWDTLQNPTLNSNKTVILEKKQGTRFTSQIDGLLPGKKHYVRAYFEVDDTAMYSEQKDFTTLMPGIPEVFTDSLVLTSINSVVFYGNVTAIKDDSLMERGICWDTEGSPDLSDNRIITGYSAGIFSGTIHDLLLDTSYYFRAYAKNTFHTAYGEIKSITIENGLAEVVTADITGILATSANCGGEILSNGGFPVTSRGICWDTSSKPTIENHHIEAGQSTGSFVLKITDLEVNTTYYIRAYATNSAGTSYGEEKNFSTSDGSIQITTGEISNINANSATASGSISGNGGSAISERGICWSVSEQPVISDNKISSGSGTGDFSVQLTSLELNTRYCLRAYAINEAGVQYGEIICFTTKTGLPEVNTAIISGITASSAISGGTVVSEGAFPVTSRGICWSTSQNPDFESNVTLNGEGAGSFVTELTSLPVNTTIYVKAYATNALGSNFGEEVSFTTKDGVIEIATKAVSEIAPNSAVSGGDISDDGGAPILSRGVCWSLDPEPEISDDKTEDGNAADTWSSQISGLEPDTTYFIRAYAVNEFDTCYGDQKSFKTLSGIAEVSTKPVANITINSAETGGTVITDGGYEVTARGVCWSITSLPTTDDNWTIDGSGTGSFTSSITALDANTLYFVRAYATNKTGTEYGDEINFTTESGLPELSTDSVTNITESSAIVWGTVVADGGAEVSTRGICWSTNPNPTVDDNKTEETGGTGSFNSYLDGLAENTRYYVRAYARNVNGVEYGGDVDFVAQKPQTGSFIDLRDGNEYTWVRIGEQVWMAENLAWLPSVSPRGEGSISESHYYVYGYDGEYVYEAKNSDIYSVYGVLYNWSAAIEVCPEGWHLPTSDEWEVLAEYISLNNGGYIKEGDIWYNVGRHLKATTRWDDNNNGTDDYEFGAIPGGYRPMGRYFRYLGNTGYFWSANVSQFAGNEASFRYVNIGDAFIRDETNKEGGFSVRCIKD